MDREATLTACLALESAVCIDPFAALDDKLLLTAALDFYTQATATIPHNGRMDRAVAKAIRRILADRARLAMAS